MCQGPQFIRRAEKALVFPQTAAGLENLRFLIFLSDGEPAPKSVFHLCSGGIKTPYCAVIFMPCDHDQ